jgi:hypothetical protein
MMTLPHYTKVKDRYCIAYFGNSKEYLVQLRLLRPLMEAKFPGTQIYLAAKADNMYLLEGLERTIDKETLRDKNRDFGYIRELNCDMSSHPIHNFLKENSISESVCDKTSKIPGPCGIFPEAYLPTRPLSDNEILQLRSFVARQGYQPKIGGKIEDLTWVIGPENEHVFGAASLGIRTTLIENGLGTDLFKQMFPKAETKKL